MENKELIYGKILDVQDEVDAITKGRKNTQQGYKFRGVDDVYNYMQPLFKKHRIFMRSEIVESKTEIIITVSKKQKMLVTATIRYFFVTDDGSSVFSEVIGQAEDYGDKGANKAMSFGQKIAIIQMFNIPTEESAKTDPDLANDEAVDEDKALIRKLLVAYKGKDKQDIADACTDAVKSKTFTEEFAAKIIEQLS